MVLFLYYLKVPLKNVTTNTIDTYDTNNKLTTPMSRIVKSGSVDDTLKIGKTVVTSNKVLESKTDTGKVMISIRGGDEEDWWKWMKILSELFNPPGLSHVEGFSCEPAPVSRPSYRGKGTSSTTPNNNSVVIPPGNSRSKPTLTKRDYSKKDAVSNQNQRPKQSTKIEVKNSDFSITSLSEKLSKEYEQFNANYYDPDLYSKRWESSNFDKERFEKLGVESRQPGFYSRISLDETRAALQAEEEGIIATGSARRLTLPDSKHLDLDFVLDNDPKYTHLDTKHPVSSLILKQQGQKTTVEQQAEKVAQGIVKQKQYWSNPDRKQGAQKPEDILHVVDLCWLLPNEKAEFEEILNNAVREIKPEFLEHIKFINN
eukprot:CAMPEP_0178693804 /NCGR_PEP_ID=MMETSP0699-20121125/7905_1 /TAXON_ID=265572 /ORGANISM="Extubocellulus spinifer, Strain CCMP396" /LENGTH=371 /DNA_ID=CAMNT_0020339235 /DNA_START=64 /DNA_END=1179 /DNA_ORIENTATION=-